MTDMTIMMRQLFSEHKAEKKHTIESTIVLQLQPLNHAIAQERIERVEAISDIQTQISDLRAAFDAFSTNPPPGHRREEGGDEIVIGGFGQKSKEGAITMVQKIIDDKAGGPHVINERTSQTPQVVPVKCSSRDHAEVFIRDHAGKKEFPNRFEGFWCSMSRTPEEREYYRKNLALLFKAKRVICEINDVDGTLIVVDKNDKKVFYVEGSELLLVCKLLPNGSMQWDNDIEQAVRDKYLALMAGH